MKHSEGFLKVVNDAKRRINEVTVDPCLCIFRISRGTIRKHYILGVLPHAARDLRLHRNKGSKENTVQHDRAKPVNTIACLNCEISDSTAVAVKLHKCTLDAL